MTNDNSGDTLRNVLNQATRERQAAEAIFQEDTGADRVAIETGTQETVVKLVYYNDSVTVLR